MEFVSQAKQTPRGDPGEKGRTMSDEKTETEIKAAMEKSALFAGEIEHKKTIASEEDWKDYTLLDAFNDVVEFADEGLLMPSVWNICKRVMIAAEMVGEFDPSTCVSIGKAYWFKMDGKYWESI